MSLGDEGYIFREVTTFKRVRIPDGHKKCARCDGRGKVVKLFKDPGPNEYMECYFCGGRGFVERTADDMVAEAEKKHV